MSRRFGPIAVAIALSAALLGTFLAFGGASYKPLEVADPCESRPLEQLEQREGLEALALSALDGAACELQVTREQVALALADPEARERFAEDFGVSQDRLDDAVRAGLVRAVDDAAAEGTIGGFEESLLREAAERAPVGALLDLLRAAPDGSLDRIGELLGLLPDSDGA